MHFKVKVPFPFRAIIDLASSPESRQGLSGLKIRANPQWEKPVLLLPFETTLPTHIGQLAISGRFTWPS